MKARTLESCINAFSIYTWKYRHIYFFCVECYAPDECNYIMIRPNVGLNLGKGRENICHFHNSELVTFTSLFHCVKETTPFFETAINQW